MASLYLWDIPLGISIYTFPYGIIIWNIPTGHHLKKIISESIIIRGHLAWALSY